MGGLARILSDTRRNRDIPLLFHAYELAERAHRGQRRRSGDRYITHPVEVATIVARHGGTVPAICAALLHDVVEDTGVRASVLHAEFGAEIAGAVDALTAGVVREGGAVSREVMLVAVADRLHNLRTLRYVAPAKRRRASIDTLAVHVPLARRLEIPAVAAEMTDLACATLDGLERRAVVLRPGRAVAAVRRVDVRGVVEAGAALGGGAAVVGSGAVPEWAVATGGAGVFALAVAVLFGRDPRGAQRLAGLIAAWKRR
ncbi:HD domain-containing protein [Pseudosporangium ferrugineum]|nr:HD domain-containing protein [Pseudosporangium ferrugineum]